MIVCPWPLSDSHRTTGDNFSVSFRKLLHQRSLAGFFGCVFAWANISTKASSWRCIWDWARGPYPDCTGWAHQFLWYRGTSWLTGRPTIPEAQMVQRWKICSAYKISSNPFITTSVGELWHQALPPLFQSNCVSQAMMELYSKGAQTPDSRGQSSKAQGEAEWCMAVHYIKYNRSCSPHPAVSLVEEKSLRKAVFPYICWTEVDRMANLRLNLVTRAQVKDASQIYG